MGVLFSRRVFDRFARAIIAAIPQLGYAWRRHAPAGLVKLAMSNVVYCVRRRRVRLAMTQNRDALDEKYGTNTAGIREIRTLDASICRIPATQCAMDPAVSKVCVRRLKS